MTNDSNATNISSRGIGVTGLLTVIFALAKIFELIDWPWLYVFLPVIISFGLTIVVLVILLVIYLAIQ